MINNSQARLKVLVDADACPRRVMEIIRRLQGEYGYDLVSVSSFNHIHKDEGPKINHIYVGDEDQAADIALINEANPHDIVVTQDWGLAAIVVGKGAKALDPNGRIFSEQNIEFLLEERHLKAKHRRGGGRTRGPAPRTEDNDRRFQAAFRRLLG